MDKSKLNMMVKSLEDAGMYEENMSEEELQNIYKVISESKDTAKEEALKQYESDQDMFELTDEVDICVKSSNKNKQENKTVFQPKTWTRDKKNLDKENDIPIDKAEQDLPEDATKANIGFEDMLKPKEPLLKIIIHPKQFVNIQNSPEFLKADVPTKAMMLYSYHTKMEKLRSNLARQSFFTASMPKPIVLKEMVIPSMERDDDFEDTYISRSGRQTKRKCYYNDEDNMLDAVTNSASKKSKSKNDDETDWISKTKPASKLVAKKLETSPKQGSQVSRIVEAKEDVEKDVPKEDHKEVTKPRSKKLTNAEIMSRSPLFADIPKRKTRCEVMFDKLNEETMKKQKEEKEQERFEKSLSMDTEDSQTDSQKDEDIIDIDDEFEPVKRRVIPPIPTRRKPIGNRTKQQKASTPPLDVTIEPASTSVQKQKINSSEDIFENVSSRIKQKSISALKENGLSVSSTTAVGSSTDVSCPLCSKMFSKESIENHASSCGDDQIVTRLASKQMVCEICDMVIRENYDLHVNECIERQKELNTNHES